MDALSAAVLPAKPLAPARAAEVDAVAQDFEAVFIAEMFKPMFAGLSTDPPFGGGRGEEVWRSLMVQEYGKAIAARGGLGLADAVKAEMLRMQGAE